MSLPATASALLQELIRIPSVNPAGHPGTPHTGEAACAEYIAHHLRSLGADTSVYDVLPGRPNVVGCYANPGKPRLLFAPHTDTVSVAGMTIEPFGGELRDGRVYGRGACDTKGSIAAMLQALRNLGSAVHGLSHEIWFAGLAGEEAGQQGARALAEAEPFDFVIAGEPTGMDVVYTHKGSHQLHLTTRGKAVHASAPHEGENAIYKMAPVLHCLQHEILPTISNWSHPVLGPSTLSVGTIEGGSKTNIVPDRCHLTVDLRTVPGQATAAWVAELERKLREVCPDLEIDAVSAVPLFTDPGHPLIRAWELGGARCVGAPWFCDAAVFAQHGRAAIAVGPGSIAQAHTQDEWIEVAALELGVRRFEEFLRRLMP